MNPFQWILILIFAWFAIVATFMMIMLTRALVTDYRERRLREKFVADARTANVKSAQRASKAGL